VIDWFMRASRPGANMRRVYREADHDGRRGDATRVAVQSVRVICHRQMRSPGPLRHSTINRVVTFLPRPLLAEAVNPAAETEAAS
jgi:hypothetical protein